MRTTLVLDDDVAAVARDLARDRGRSFGSVVSELARAGLRQPFTWTMVDGIPTVPQRGNVLVTLEIVNALREDPFKG
jgi:hypothetical protein